MLASLRKLIMIIMSIATIISFLGMLSGVPLLRSSTATDDHIVLFGLCVMILSIVFISFLRKRSFEPQAVYLLTTAYIITLVVGFSRLIYLKAVEATVAYSYTGLGVSYGETLHEYLGLIIPAVFTCALLVWFCFIIATDD